MASVVVELTGVHGILQVASQGNVLAQVQRYIVLQCNGFGPNSRTRDRRGHHNGDVLEEQAMDARCSLRGIQGVGSRRVNQLNLHAHVGHLADVHASTVTHRSNRERQGATHGRGFNRRKLAVSFPSEQTVLGYRPDVVRTQRSIVGAQRTQRRDERMVGRARLRQQEVVP